MIQMAARRGEPPMRLRTPPLRAPAAEWVLDRWPPDAIVPSLNQATRRDSTERGSPAGAGSTSSLSRVGQNTKTADHILAARAATPRPVDAVLSAVSRAVGFQCLTMGAYAKTGRLLDAIVPAKVKAEVVSNYGLPEAVIDQRTVAGGNARACCAPLWLLIPTPMKRRAE